VALPESPPLALAFPPSFLPVSFSFTCTDLASPDVLPPVEPPSPPMVLFSAFPEVLPPEKPPLALAVVLTLPFVSPVWLPVEPPVGLHELPCFWQVSAEPVLALPL